MRRDTNTPVPTLAELRRHSSWVWVYCERCLHHSPVAFVPLMNRWGADASSDKLRRCARCTACGQRGATLQHPGWVDAQIGFQLFPGKSSYSWLGSDPIEHCSPQADGLGDSSPFPRSGG